MRDLFATSSSMWLSPATTAWGRDWTPVPLRTSRHVHFVMSTWCRLTRRAASRGAPPAEATHHLYLGLVQDVPGLPRDLRGLALDQLAQDSPGAQGYLVVGALSGDLAVLGADDAGLLYGALRLVVVGPRQMLAGSQSRVSTPALGLRMLNHWDNLVPHPVMGTVERGYAGDSLFWQDGQLAQDLGRIEDYALVLASLGINAVSINNVNVHATEATLLTDRLDLVARIADIMRPYHVRVHLAVSFSSPMLLGGLGTCDPLDAQVAAWWRGAVDRLYEAVPDLGGFVIKADSEGQPGPFAYGRTHADGANTVAAALAPHGGVLAWRCFVYNHRQDWRDRTTDRARAAYDHFMPLDGQFADNVLLQVKNGPMDFQVREPVSPLLLGLRSTRTSLELQITQEYTGHQWDTYFLPTAWREVLDLDVAGDGGRRFGQDLTERPGSAIVAVANTGRDHSWTGNPLSQANLYGYGRLAWDPCAPADQIAEEWARATFADPQVAEAVTGILLASRDAYERYTAPLGVGFMVTPGTHYGPSIEGYEYTPWGTYHFADRDGVGVDRTPTGSGFTEQYPPALAQRYRDLETCPEALVLFFHHLPYDQVLPASGTTLIQRIYDTHIEGVEQVRAMRASWEAVRGRAEPALREDIDSRLEAQERNAVQWRDQVCTYFLRHSGVPDAHGRPIAS